MLFHKGKVSLIICVLYNVCITNVYTANILGLFTSHSPSHLIVHMSVVKVLAEHGHNVTVVVTQKPKVDHEKIHKIIIPPTAKQQQSFNDMLSKMSTRSQNLLTTFTNIFGSLSVLVDMQVDALKDERFTQLYDGGGDVKFDLVILGYFFNTYQVGVAGKLGVPLIINWSASPLPMLNALVGNPTANSYVPNINMAVRPGHKMNFIMRLQNLLSSVFFSIISQIIELRMSYFYSSLFQNDELLPSYDEMKKNVSLIFCNSHFSDGPLQASVPALVEIGGIQIKEQPHPLPKDLATFLNNSSTHGAILFSLGSNVKSSSLKPETIQIIFNVLSDLKQHIIWKWEDLTNIPGKSSNILYQKWLPQDDILAHSNLKLFLTHAGKGGITEAQYHGVPMIALPIFADQYGNAGKMVDAGYGKQLHLTSLTENIFRSTILEVLNNPFYRENVQKFSHLYRDRPLSARQSVAYWTNYVLRHHGARHMQSPLVHMNFIESENIDVFCFLILICFIVVRVSILLIGLIVAKVFRKPEKIKSH